MGDGHVRGVPSAFSEMSAEDHKLKTSLFILVMLLCLAQIHVVAYARDRPSVLIAGLYVAYVSLHCATSFVIAKLGKSSHSAHTESDAVEIVFVALVAKLLIAALMFSAEDVRKEESRLSSRFQELRSARWTMMCMAIPAFLYTVSDVLVVSCQEVLSLTEVQVVSKANVIFTSIMWTFLFRSPISSWKWIGLILIVLGGSIFFGGEPLFRYMQWSVAESRDDTQKSAVVFGAYHALLIGQVCICCAAGLSCEYLLREKSGSVNLQNIAQYSWALLFLCVTKAPKVSLGQLSHQALLAVALFTAVGIVTSYLLKHLGSVWKQAAYGNMVFLYFFIDYMFCGAKPTIYHLCGMFIVFMGTAAFVLDGWKPLGASADANKQPKVV
eukprot:TRINITY_DN26989_c0_g1_i1.p1 TRINITY_DN26989_c0_g1~~TRINITY_DN26989_c0_g1_i1.p1  ORF type:complete len:401 (-),score=51.11 TRINITY_DN26989_c0_g1_i1:115-1263(-)